MIMVVGGDSVETMKQQGHPKDRALEREPATR